MWWLFATMAMSCRGEIPMPFLVAFSEGLYAVSKPCKPIVSSRACKQVAFLAFRPRRQPGNVRHNSVCPEIASGHVASEYPTNLLQVYLYARHQFELDDEVSICCDTLANACSMNCCAYSLFSCCSFCCYPSPQRYHHQGPWMGDGIMPTPPIDVSQMRMALSLPPLAVCSYALGASE